ncbi:o-succinylbenzoate--CoA ligase [Saccharomonospora azurea]|uniref:Acyl-CoA synthetase (AMP-forming)/AMP-acid ligase II n=1 Tax=Saccharomonospora azurea NA-128 TaxID=882081 RepID=H8GEQ3_9PSEU|nr:o-succinylbenzoate--CoA ligase [Saccharomonospora azurea]EHK86820.1 acyl-CoA synthetase (AMP-forming)/AMP-acid ligase II [Saccharomonospora azurea SZMC 14600]EHY89964.1 acyl-CoA synthetase (AMP-forming)/AMP-acid ligase II [Saccharomonospora azurea NA-128]
MRVIRSDGSVESVAELTRAVLDALDGGPAVLPLDPRNPAADSVRAAMRPDEPVEPGTAVIITTSGSTGRPKGTLLSARALLASAHATHARLGGPGRWLLATPPGYIGGLQVLVRSHLAGTTPGVVDLSRGFRPEAFDEAAREVLSSPGPHYTALVPTQLSRLLDAGGAQVARFDAIVLGGAAYPDELRRRAERAGVSVIPSYGMSETASGCVYDGDPLDGVRVRLGADDRVEVSGPVLAHGYRLDPAATAEAFVDGWFRTSDVGRWTDDGRLQVLGRLDDMINTGGVKVPARQVEDALLRHPGVRAAGVVGLPDPEWGRRVAAVVATTDELDLDSVRDAVRADLGAAATPKQLLVVDELPLIGPGKVDRSALRRLLLGHVDHGTADAEE